MAIDHTACTHPRTPAGRRACRAGRASTPELLVRGELATDEVTITPPAVRRARVAAMQDRLMSMADEPLPNRRRQRASEAVRIQPRRGGARVPARAAGCVQAALHINAHGGKCACGWAAQVSA